MDEQIKAEFVKCGFSVHQEEILQKCLTYCINFKLSVSDLVSHWEVYYLNRQLSGFTVEDAEMNGFLSHLQNEQKESILKEDAHLHVYSSNDIDILLNIRHDDDDIQEGLPSSPTKQDVRSSIDPYNSPASNTGAIEKLSTGKSSALISNHVTPFGQRSNKFISLFTLKTDENGDDDTGAREQELQNPEADIIRRVQPSKRCSLQVHCSLPKPGCRFMYDRTENKCNALEDRIRRFASEFAASGFHEVPTAPTLASEENIFAVGMICCDSEGHLNEKSILLQGSVENCGGERVRLDLQKLPQFSFYPGQVIGVHGRNPSGHCFVASKVIDYLPLAPNSGLPHAKRPALDQDNVQASPSTASRVISLVIASGPFSTTDNLLFEPLVELLAYASRKQPQLLVLMGPFVDSEHPNINKGTVGRTFDDIFKTEVLRRLLDFIEYMGPAVRIVLLPSVRDAHHDFVFPQPAFEIHPPDDIHHQIICAANPSFFSANEVTFGCTTSDILKHLSSEEISRIPANSSSKDRMSRLATHVLSQRSFYPLYPSSPHVPLDLSLAPKALEIPSVPDILLLPSDLTPFAKVLTLGEAENAEEPLKCFCVNPGRLAKGIGGGTFIEMKYNGCVDKTNISILRI